MRNLKKLEAEKLLEITEPEALYSREPKMAREEYRSLVKAWHPDRTDHPMARTVLERLLALYREAKIKSLDGTWVEPVEKAEAEEPGRKRVRLEDGSIKAIFYYRRLPVELGNLYIDDHSVTFEIGLEFEELLKEARKTIYSLSSSFADKEMAIEMSRYLPEILESFRSRHYQYLVIRKTPDQFLLADAGKLEKEHVAWILNNLYNLACFLEYAGITHNAINTETVFISPLRHSVMLLGGWWYSCKTGDELKALPDSSLEIIPISILESGRAGHAADLALIKALGLCLLEKGETALRPSLSAKTADTALEEYQKWKHEALESVFGEPKFVELKMDKASLYRK
ncbi:hypothetical protein GC174_15790 [bacterium]|nr:hypothetical protein [bacterium]